MQPPAPDPKTVIIQFQEALQHAHGYAASRWMAFAARYQAKVFYDIGANNPFDDTGGAVAYYKRFFPEAQFHLVEGASKHEPALKKSGYPYSTMLLSDEDFKEVTFYESAVSLGGGGDSYYLENMPTYRGDRRIETTLTTMTLDSVAKQHEWPMPDFIKLDTQGSELDILRGAKNVLDHASFVLVECATQNYNRGAPLMHEVIGFMAERGFRIHDIMQIHFVGSVMLQADVLFVRSTHSFANLLKDIE